MILIARSMKSQIAIQSPQASTLLQSAEPEKLSCRLPSAKQFAHQSGKQSSPLLYPRLTISPCSLGACHRQASRPFSPFGHSWRRHLQLPPAAWQRALHVQKARRTSREPILDLSWPEGQLGMSAVCRQLPMHLNSMFPHKEYLRPSK